MSNVATLAGHVTVEDHAVVGGLAAVHQFCRIGKLAMIGGCSKVVQDVPPFMIADGNPAETRTINKVGMERNGISEDAQNALKSAYKILFREGLTISNALAKLSQRLLTSSPTILIHQHQHRRMLRRLDHVLKLPVSRGWRDTLPIRNSDCGW